MRDIIVTTPKSQIAAAAAEAEHAKKSGGHYFRKLSSQPKHVDRGSRVFYVEDGYIAGFATVSHVRHDFQTCSSSGKSWTGLMVFMPVESWQWIEPILEKGFQGWRYFDAPPHMKIVGGWLDPKPMTDSQIDSYLRARGWMTHQSPLYWVHPDAVEDPGRQDFTRYGMSLREALAYEQIGKPKHQPMGSPAASRIDLTHRTEGLKRAPVPPANYCKCELMCRRWNPNTGRCESCWLRYQVKA